MAQREPAWTKPLQRQTEFVAHLPPTQGKKPKQTTIFQYPEGAGELLNTQTMLLGSLSSLDWGSPGFPILLSSAPRRTPEVFTHHLWVTWPWDTLFLCNAYTKETKLLWISPSVQKRHPRHANTAKLLHPSGSSDTSGYTTVIAQTSLSLQHRQGTVIFLDLDIPSPVEPYR